MKLTSLFLIAVIGFAVVSAELELEEQLSQALRELLENDAAGLQLESRDTYGGCMRDTANCNNLGACIQGRWGGYYCRCNVGARVGGPDSSCYSVNQARSDEELATREIISRCQTDTNNCNGNGVCQLSAVSRKNTYVCVCDTGFVNDVKGSCVAQSKREMAMLDMSLRDSKMRCEADTNECNGKGQCSQGRFGDWKCVCDDNVNYKIDRSGSCVAVNEEREVESLQSRTAELMTRLQAMLKSEE